MNKKFVKLIKSTYREIATNASLNANNKKRKEKKTLKTIMNTNTSMTTEEEAGEVYRGVKPEDNDSNVNINYSLNRNCVACNNPCLKQTENESNKFFRQTARQCHQCK